MYETGKLHWVTIPRFDLYTGDWSGRSGKEHGRGNHFDLVRIVRKKQPALWRKLVDATDACGEVRSSCNNPTNFLC